MICYGNPLKSPVVAGKGEPGYETIDTGEILRKFLSHVGPTPVSHLEDTKGNREAACALNGCSSARSEDTFGLHVNTNIRLNFFVVSLSFAVVKRWKGGEKQYIMNSTPLYTTISS